MPYMGRPPLHMKLIKINFSPEMLAEIDALVGEMNRSKFIREATAGAIKTAKHVKATETTPDKDRE